MPNCLYLPAWLRKKMETCMKCHEPGFVWKPKSRRPCPGGTPACVSSCLLRFPRVLLTLGPARQTHFASCLLLLLHPWLRKSALITGSVCPLFSDKPIRSWAEAQALGFGSCCRPPGARLAACLGARGQHRVVSTPTTHVVTLNPALYLCFSWG